MDKTRKSDDSSEKNARMEQSEAEQLSSKKSFMVNKMTAADINGLVLALKTVQAGAPA